MPWSAALRIKCSKGSFKASMTALSSRIWPTSASYCSGLPSDWARSRTARRKVSVNMTKGNKRASRMSVSNAATSNSSRLRFLARSLSIRRTWSSKVRCQLPRRVASCSAERPAPDASARGDLESCAVRSCSRWRRASADRCEIRSSPAKFNIRSSRSEGTRTVNVSSAAGAAGGRASGDVAPDAPAGWQATRGSAGTSSSRPWSGIRGLTPPARLRGAAGPSCGFGRWRCAAAIPGLESRATRSNWAKPWSIAPRFTCSGAARNSSRMSSSPCAVSLSASRPTTLASPFRLCAWRNRLLISSRRTSGSAAVSRSRNCFSSPPKCSRASSRKMSKIGSCDMTGSQTANLAAVSFNARIRSPMATIDFCVCSAAVRDSLEPESISAILLTN